MTLTFIGIGNVGFAIANNLEQKGFDIIIGSDNSSSESVKKALSKNPKFRVLSIQDAIDVAEVIFLATPFNVNQSILKTLDFQGKPLVDCTNPVGSGISHGLNSEVSGSEKIQEWTPTSNVVKAFSIYGFENFSSPKYLDKHKKPVMLYAGNDNDAKQKVAIVIEACGFFAKDIGAIDQALHLEHMTLLWVKMVRRDGHHPNFMWAYLGK